MAGSRGGRKDLGIPPVSGRGRPGRDPPETAGTSAQRPCGAAKAGGTAGGAPLVLSMCMNTSTDGDSPMSDHQHDEDDDLSFEAPSRGSADELLDAHAH